MANFDESKHPRDDDGKFTDGNGSQWTTSKRDYSNVQGGEAQRVFNEAKQLGIDTKGIDNLDVIKARIAEKKRMQSNERAELEHQARELGFKFNLSSQTDDELREMIKTQKRKNATKEYFKKQGEAVYNRFFGERQFKSNQYFKFNHVIDNDNIIVNTSNLKEIRGKNGEPSLIMLVGDDQAVYIKPWQVMPIYDYYSFGEGYAVKLNRTFFKPYKFKSKIADDISFDGRVDTFDSLKKDAESQNDTPIRVDTGERSDFRNFRWFV